MTNRTRTPDPDPAPWHALEIAEVFAACDCTRTGLTEAEAERRRKTFGPNLLPRSAPISFAGLLLRQFRNPLIYILAVAAVISIALGEFIDAWFIAAVLAVNALIGGYQEWRAQQGSRALEKLLHIRTSVLRDGEAREDDAEALVPGDVVWLESGNRVPADLRLISAGGLEVDESLLTGESLAVHKDAEWKGEAASPLADRRNMAFAGATVVRGRTEALVVATGRTTTIGRLAMDIVGQPAGKPPLLVRLERFTRVVGVVVLIAAAGVAGAGIARGFAIEEMFFIAVALAVSAIPEGLPVAVTVALSIATNRMAKLGVITRKLAAVEGLGSCTFIASDKTGTLTCNELTAVEFATPTGERFEVTGEGFAPEGRVLLGGEPIEPGGNEPLHAMLRAAALCNEGGLHRRDRAWTWRGDPTDVALLSAAHKAGWSREGALEKHPQVNAIPFEPERRFAATFNRVGDRVRVFVKGAPERVLEMCVIIEEDERARALELAKEMASRGLRVLAFADGEIETDLSPNAAPPTPSELRWLGFAGMIDPLRAGAKEAVAQCLSAGVTVSMVTGDHPVTALAIGRELGFAASMEEVIAGTQMAQMSDEALSAAVSAIRVFARTTPEDKLRIVRAARAAGHFIAVTGDGVNDAPALRAANIGVAMGRAGTDVARDAAEIVISDDNFATIVSGIEQGRIAYNNIRNVIYLLISTGAAELVMVMGSLIAGMPIPLLPAQLLWLNLVTNGIQDVALAFEPGEGSELRRKPRPPRERIFNRLMIERTLVAALTMGAIGLGAFAWMRNAGWTDEAARSSLLLLMVLFENVHVGNCRSETRSAFALSPLKTPILLFGVISAFLLHVAAMHSRFGAAVLRTEAVGLRTWIALGGLALTIFFVMEAHKWLWNRREARRAA